MKRRSEGEKNWQLMRDRIVGLGEKSVRKSYYPELKGKIQDLEHQRAFLESILNSIPEGVVVYRPDGSIIQGNPALYQLFGYPEGMLTGRDINLLVADDTGERDEHAPPGARCLRRSDGTTFYGRVSSSVIHTQEGDSLGELMVIRDLTERISWIRQRQELEQQLQQSQKMEALGTLAGGIAHDFNNLLAAILGYAELSQLKMAPQEPAYHGLSQIIAASRKASALVQQILAFSRQERSQRRVMLLAPLVKEIVKLLHGSIPSTIRIRAEIIDPDARVIVDPTQIHQVLMNLCTNAFHAMEERGGDLTIRLEKAYQDAMPLEQELLGNYVRIVVTDTGTGIDQAIQDRIFDPYFTTKAKGKGTGMGLAVVHGVVKGHGGFVRVRSRKGWGTRIEILLPATDEVLEGEMDSAERHVLAVGRERILAVDDEEMLLEILKSCLEGLGYQVTTMGNGKMALEHFLEDPTRYDLVVSDQTMPGLTGLDMAMGMHAVRPDLPVILCSGYSASLTEERLEAAGIETLISKPASIDVLVGAIRSALDFRANR
jgi:PAS domain S-box-containing protein